LSKKKPFADKSSEREGRSSWGFKLENSDHHPKAVLHSLDRACPGEIPRGGRWFCSVVLLELFPSWPLLAEEKEEGILKITTRRA